MTITKIIHTIVSTGTHNFHDNNFVYEGQKRSGKYDIVLDHFDSTKECIYYLQKRHTLNQCAWCKMLYDTISSIPKRCVTCNKQLTIVNNSIEDAEKIKEENERRGMYAYSIRKVIKIKKITSRTITNTPRWKLYFQKNFSIEPSMRTRVHEDIMEEMVKFTHKNFAINKISFIMSCGLLPYETGNYKTQPGIFRCTRADENDMKTYVEFLQNTFKPKYFGKYLNDN